MRRFESAENGRVIYCKSNAEIVPSVADGATFAEDKRKVVEQAINKLINEKDETNTTTAAVAVDFTVLGDRPDSVDDSLSLVYELMIKLNGTQNRDLVADIAKILEELVQ